MSRVQTPAHSVSGNEIGGWGGGIVTLTRILLIRTQGLGTFFFFFLISPVHHSRHDATSIKREGNMWSFMRRSITMRCLTLPQSLPNSLFSINKTNVFRSVSEPPSISLFFLYKFLCSCFFPSSFPSIIYLFLFLDLGLLLSILEVHCWFVLFDVW